MASKLHVAFVWHMHQPQYKDRATGRYMMPWARLHAVKDYLDMAVILKDYPGLRQTFNLVPSLLEQLEDYAAGAWDDALALLARPVEDWGANDRRYLFERGFDLHHPTMLRPHSRYAELADRRAALTGRPFEVVEERFEAQDWADLVTWFNLAWIDPRWVAEDPDLAALVAKGRGFSMSDRTLLIEKHRALVARVIPTYAEMADSGQLELTTTPYYHPILPLLCDTDSAHAARPDVPLPERPFRHPGDARHQVDRGIEAFERHFGRRPRGMWPSEQSVSPETVALMAQAGLNWAISDEGVLGRTLGMRFERNVRGIPVEASALYRPYTVETAAGPLAMVFRDVVLSDLIGFSYAAMPPETAAQDLYDRLVRTRQVLSDGEAHLVTIALDGENCWEHYEGDGGPFLHAFYRRVAADPAIELVTVGDYLDRHPPVRSLPTIFSGSWIGTDFTTWIGEPTKNRAWALLGEAREALMACEPTHAGTPAWAEAWEEIAIAEGSDWFWWFGTGHDSGQDERFDAQFRLHLAQVYALMGLEAPAALDSPLALGPAPGLVVPDGLEPPAIDGGFDAAEWRMAGRFDPAEGQGAMHRSATMVSALHYGLGSGHLYLAATFASLASVSAHDELVLYFCYPGQPRLNAPIPFPATDGLGPTAGYGFAHALHVSLGDRPRAVWHVAAEYGRWRRVTELVEVAVGSALELALPLELLDAPVGQPVQLVVAAVQDDMLIAVMPGNRTLEFVMPAIEALA